MCAVQGKERLGGILISPRRKIRVYRWQINWLVFRESRKTTRGEAKCVWVCQRLGGTSVHASCIWIREGLAFGGRTSGRRWIHIANIEASIVGWKSGGVGLQSRNVVEIDLLRAVGV